MLAIKGKYPATKNWSFLEFLFKKWEVKGKFSDNLGQNQNKIFHVMS